MCQMGRYHPDDYEPIEDVKAKKVSDWIPVSERLPEYKSGVEYMWFQPEQVGARAEYGLSARCVIDRIKPHRETTHWMPLPDAPEVDE